MSGFAPETTASSELVARRESVRLEQQLLFALYRAVFVSGLAQTMGGGRLTDG